MQVNPETRRFVRALYAARKAADRLAMNEVCVRGDHFEALREHFALDQCVSPQGYLAIPAEGGSERICVYDAGDLATDAP